MAARLWLGSSAITDRQTLLCQSASQLVRGSAGSATASGLFSGREGARRPDVVGVGTARSHQALGELECFSSGKASALAPRCSASTACKTGSAAYRQPPGAGTLAEIPRPTEAGINEGA